MSTLPSAESGPSSGDAIPDDAERRILKQPRILSLDGGGVRGLSSLLILKDIMEEIRRKAGHESTPLPCEYFDLIGGTSTGGLIAIMLGRLRMSVEECIAKYLELSKEVFNIDRAVGPHPNTP
jgi:patatin-like phospholipase/acyl hydrolase